MDGSKNNCAECYYSDVCAGYLSCAYIKKTGKKRPCKVEDCEIWRTAKKGRIPEETVWLKHIRTAAKNKRKKLSKEQVDELARILVGEKAEEAKPKKSGRKKMCHACGKELRRDAIFCQYCGTRVQAE